MYYINNNGNQFTINGSVINLMKQLRSDDDYHQPGNGSNFFLLLTR